MPGSSLWLVPPPQSKINAIISALILETVPAAVPSVTPPAFSPHVTLTSELPDYFDDPKAWLDGLEFPFAEDVKVQFEGIDVEQPFFRKCNIRCGKAGVKALALECRNKGVEPDRNKASEWIEKEYRPHCSLLYANLDISEEKKAEIEKAVADAGISLQGDGSLGGWEGGTVWLVPTGITGIEDWKPIAERKLATDIKKSYATAGS